MVVRTRLKVTSQFHCLSCFLPSQLRLLGISNFFSFSIFFFPFSKSLLGEEFKVCRYQRHSQQTSTVAAAKNLRSQQTETAKSCHFLFRGAVVERCNVV